MELRFFIKALGKDSITGFHFLPNTGFQGKIRSLRAFLG